jgi:hypothetical protein
MQLRTSPCEGNYIAGLLFSSFVIYRSCTIYMKFRWRRWGSSLPGLTTLDPPLSPPSKPAEIFRLMFLSWGVTKKNLPKSYFLANYNPMQFVFRRWGSSLPVCARLTSARPPIDTSRNFPPHVSAESPLNTSPNPSKVIS